AGGWRSAVGGAARRAAWGGVWGWAARPGAAGGGRGGKGAPGGGGGGGGARHEGRSAQAGQHGPAEPLDRYAAAIDDVGRPAVDEQRRVVPHINRVGRGFCPSGAAHFSLVPDLRPLRPQPCPPRAAPPPS